MVITQGNGLNRIYFTSIKQKLIELINVISKAHMLAFCGLAWRKKTEYPEKTTDFGRATTNLPHAESGNRTGATVLTSDGFTSALARHY